MLLYEFTSPPQERTYLALSHRLLAKIADAEGKPDDAKLHLSRAVAIVEHAKLPLAAWRVYMMEAHLHERAGEMATAVEFRNRSKQVITALFENLDHDDPLRASLLAGYATEALR
jgi:hypothetical protein